MNAPQHPYERFLQSLPARIDAHAGKPRATVFERLRQEFRAACPNSSAGPAAIGDRGLARAGDSAYFFGG